MEFLLYLHILTLSQINKNNNNNNNLSLIEFMDDYINIILYK
jgi:hypothetical protein